MVTPEVRERVLNTRSMLRERETSLVEALGPPHKSIDESYKTVTLASGRGVRLKIWRSSTTPISQRSLILLFHGGGFVAGSIEMCTQPGREFAKAFGAVVVSSSYRLAPENEFPAAVQDGMDVTRWLSMHAAEELGVNLAKGFIVGGMSVGGNLAAVIAKQLKHEPLLCPITGSFMSIPLLLVKSIVPEKFRDSWTSRADSTLDHAYFDPKADEKIVERLQADVNSPLFSPLNDLPGLEGLPRTYLQMGDNDPLRDDGVIYGKALEEAGVEVKMDVHLNVGHEGFSIWYNEEKGSPKALKTKTMEGMAWLLSRIYCLPLTHGELRSELSSEGSSELSNEAPSERGSEGMSE